MSPQRGTCPGLAGGGFWSLSPGRAVTAVTGSSGISNNSPGPEAQKVLSSRQWHPHPVGHTSWVRNHSIMWLVCPPCPQVRQKLDEPRTATWQMAHWKVKPLQMAHCVPRTSLRQWLQYTPNSGGGETAKKRDTMNFLLQKRTALCKLRKMHSLWDSGGSYQTVLFQWQNPFDSLTQSYLYRGASAPQGRAQAEGVAGAWPSEALGRNPRSLQSWRLHLLFPPQQLRGLAQLGGR